nr:hypothetical protein [Hyphomonas atlantica]
MNAHNRLAAHCRKFGLVLNFFRFQGDQLLLEGSGRNPFGNCIDNPVNAPAGFSDSLFKLKTFAASRLLLANEFCMKFTSSRFLRIRMKQGVVQSCEDAFFKLFGGNGSIVRAGAFLPSCRATVPVLGNNRHRAAAGTAFEEPRQEPCRSFCSTTFPGVPLLAKLHSLPEFIINNPKVRNLIDDPFAFGISPHALLAGERIRHLVPAVPYASADIEFVVQDAVAGMHLSIDRRSAPVRTARRCDTFLVQHSRDASRRLSFDEQPHDPSDGLRFVFVDGQDAILLTRYDIVTEAMSSGRSA